MGIVANLVTLITAEYGQATEGIGIVNDAMDRTPRELLVNIEANTAAIREGLAAIVGEEREVGAGASEAGAHMGMLSGVMHSFLVQQILFTAFAKAVGFLNQQIKDVGTQTNLWQAAQTQLNAVLKSTNDVSGMTAQRAIAYANAMSQVTTFSNSTILKGEDMMLTFTGIAKNAFPQAMNAALDLATAMHEDLSSAVMQVSKALQNPTIGMVALRREGVDFSAAQSKLIKQWVDTGQTARAQAYILKELQREFGGSAHAAGTTMAGALKILGNQFDIVKENIGKAVIPIITQLLRSLEPIMSRVPAGMKLLGSILGTLGPGFHELLSLLRALGDAFNHSLQPAITQIEGAFRGAGKSGVNLAAIFAPLITFARELGTFIATELVPVLLDLGGFIAKNILPALGQLATFFNQSVVPMLMVAANVIRTQVIPAVENVAQAILSKMLPPLERILSRVLPVLGPLFQAVGWILGNVVGPALAFVATLIGGLLNVVDGIIVVLGNFFGWLGNVGQAIGKVVQQVGIVKAILVVVLGPIGLLIAGIIMMVQHWGQVTTALGHFKDGLGNVAGAVGGFIGGTLGAFGTAIHKIGDAFTWLASHVVAVWKAIAGTIKGVLNVIIGAIDTVIGAWNNIKISIPHVDLPGGHSIGGGTIGVPQIPLIPQLASGGEIAVGGLATVGERGREDVYLPAGARVYPHGMGATGHQGAPAQQTIILQLDSRVLAQTVVKGLPAAVRLGTGTRSF